MPKKFSEDGLSVLSRSTNLIEEASDFIMMGRTGQYTERDYNEIQELQNALRRQLAMAITDRDSGMFGVATTDINTTTRTIKFTANQMFMLGGHVLTINKNEAITYAAGKAQIVYAQVYRTERTYDTPNTVNGNTTTTTTKTANFEDTRVSALLKDQTTRVSYSVALSISDGTTLAGLAAKDSAGVVTAQTYSAYSTWSNDLVPYAYRAGQGQSTKSVLKTIDGYVLAVPLFTISSAGAVTDVRSRIAINADMIAGTPITALEKISNKNVANGYAGLDSLRNVTGNGIRLGANPYYTNQAFLLTWALTSTNNQKADIIISGAVHGRIRVTISGAYAGVDARGSLVKVYSAILSPPNTINSGVSRYVEATENLPDHISIGEIGYDTVNSRYFIPIEARSAFYNTYSVTVESWSSIRDATFSLSPVYIGTGATTLPKAAPVIENTAVLFNGKEFQKHKLTENDGAGTPISSGNVDTLTTTGLYNIQNSSVTGLPLATTGLLEVEHFIQRFTETPTMRTWKRRLSGGTWNAWVEDENASRKNVANGYAGLDANAFVPDERIAPNISRQATRLVADMNLNDVIGEGTYHCDSNAIAGTILNMPPAIANLAFGLRVTKTAGAVGFNQEIYCYSLAGTTSPKRYTRNYYNGTWSSWQEIETTASKGVANGYAGLDASVRVPRNNVYNSLGGANTIPAVDLDLVLTAGVYPISPVTLNKPSASMWGQVLVFVSGAETHNNANTWTWQIILQSSGGSHMRYKDAAAVWSAWFPVWTGYNDTPLMVTRGTVPNNTDFNTLTVNGVYMVYMTTGATNSPPVTYGIMTVSKAGSNYVKQEVADVVTGNIHTRIGNVGSSWTAWKTPETIDKKNVANGYVGLDANAAINVDKVIANKLRTGGFYRKQLGAFATTQNVANEKVDIVIPDMISGYIDIVLTGGFSYQQAFGQLRKRISVYTASPVTGQANAGTIYGMESRYVETIGYISADYAISDLFYDASSQSYRIRISKLNAGSGNNIQVYIEGLASGNTHADNFEKATLSTISTGDTTVPAVPVRSFLKPTVFKDIVTNETMSIRPYGSNITKYGNVASYFLGAANYVGTLKIKLPVGWTSAMMHIKITGYDYSSRGTWELALGGYNFTTGWTMLSASVTTMSGTSLPFSSVRFAYEGGKCCILLGNTTTAWQYPSIEVTEVLASASGANTLGSNWIVDISTDETGITNALSTPIRYGNSDTLAGRDLSLSNIANTIPLRGTDKKIADVPLARGYTYNNLVATTSNVSMCSYTPIGAGMYEAKGYLRLTSPATVEVNVTFYDGKAQTSVMLPSQLLEAKSYHLPTLFLAATSASPISIEVKSSVANVVYIYAVIEEA